MKFRINTEQFKRAVAPAADVALKNLEKDRDRDRTAFYCAYLLTIEASSNGLNIMAYVGCASITVKVGETEGYVCEEGGVITVKAKELLDALKSFSPTASISVCEDDYQLRLSSESDKKVAVELPTIDITIKCPRLPKTFVQKSAMDRVCFVKGMKKVMYAMATKDKYPSYMFSSYMCLLFESWRTKMRFTAGSGDRFARCEITDYPKAISSGELRILFPKRNVGNIVRVFNKLSDKTMQITVAEHDTQYGACEQIVLESDNVVLALYDFKDHTEYPDLSRILNHDYSYRISAPIINWKHAASAIAASEDSYRTRVSANLRHSYFDIKLSAEMQIREKVNFDLETYVADTSKPIDHMPWFCCYSGHLLETVKKGYKDGTVIVSFEDQTGVDDMPDGKPKQLRPIVLTCPERANKDGISEKFSVLFTASSGWEE